jgi:hypothetical protein
MIAQTKRIILGEATPITKLIAATDCRDNHLDPNN